MEDQDQEVIREFLVESHENLARLDQELVALEKHPKDAALLASIFRTIHTIKGTCGFLGFGGLERVTHSAETLLSQLRDARRELTPDLVTLILETVDATRAVLASIEQSGTEGPARFDGLVGRLQSAAELNPEATHEPPPNSPAGGPKNEDDGTRGSAVADSNIRVGVGLLDKLMDLVGELVLTRNQILQFTTEREDPALNATSQRLNLITSELQEGVMKTRMQPIGMVWNKLPRVVRDIAVSLHKQVRLQMEGTDTELDRTIIEAIKDPLVHLVRNACDHGIELPSVRVEAGKAAEGVLWLRAYHEGGQVNIEISDDGAGIDVQRIKQSALLKGLLRPEQAETISDRDALNLIFHPGFSTAREVTNVSGRGVGMDVVKSHIEKIGGVVDVFSSPGEGTTVKLKIPLTLAIIPGLVVTSGGERFVIPQVSLLELVRLEGDATDRHIEQVHGTPVYRRRGSLLPVAYLNEVLGLPPLDCTEAVNMVVLQAEESQFGLIVEGINDTQEIVVKPLGKQLKGLTMYAGATIMGDGRVALILDVLGIGQRSGVLATAVEQSGEGEEFKGQLAEEVQRLLLFRTGSFDRLAVPLSLVARLEEFPAASIERASGSPVVQYRNRILPLIPLRELLACGVGNGESASDPVQVIVFSDGDRSAGLLVDQIIDVAEEVVTIKQQSGRLGLLGSAVVGKQITDFLDLNYVLHGTQQSWSLSQASVRANRSVVVAEPSAFTRSLLRGGLDMAGYTVFEAGSLEELLRTLEQHSVDVIVSAIDLCAGGGAGDLITAVRRRPQWKHIPIVALAASVGGFAAEPRFDDLVGKFDYAGMLTSVERLAAAVQSAENSSRETRSAIQ
jgi:two-component system chemotaxis sensor kinase CheA